MDLGLTAIHSFFFTLTLSHFREEMSPAAGECSKIHHVIRIRQLLLKWHKKARKTPVHSEPSDVPAGHVVVCVGQSSKRFIVRVA